MDEVDDGGGIDPHHIAHQTDVGGFAVDDRLALAGREQGRILTRKTHRQRSVGIDEPDELA